MAGEEIFFEQIRSSGCLSYILGCKQDRICVVIDPEIDKADDYVELARFFGSTLHYAIDTHTHADHNSACKVMRERYGIQVVMHRAAEAPYVDLKVEDGDEIKFGKLSLKVVYTPGHTQDAMCLLFRDRIFTGDTLLIGGAAGPICREATPSASMTVWRNSSLLAINFASIPVMIIGRPFRRSAKRRNRTPGCSFPPGMNSFN